MRTIIVRRKLCTRVFLDDVAVSSSPYGGISRVVPASLRAFCSYARVRCIRVIGVTRIRFIVHMAMCATPDIQGEAFRYNRMQPLKAIGIQEAELK